ncbi:PIG-L deacetylase family protein [Rhodohalobacter mucosus]|uniref:PIG-L domain-containing protein n=1 Tax=Rhodohalobacter mucosus TaxID=2079485 RepID=A0A316TT91_9BACT|nr:PIG-L deacetylase family protein [Rhodohalobacter mucosus]PWN07813.1 PIG-L domain-containing protein [Rhodohalobacter mucosus]
MIELNLPESKERGLNILCLGAHCDDIEIGCGGTVLKLLEKYSVEKVTWVVFCSNEIRKQEAEVSANEFLASVPDKDIRVMSYRDGFLPDSWTKVKEEFESLKKEFNPDLIFTHTRQDRHQDHRTIHELTWNTFRNHMILEYEIPKYDGDLGNPNLFVPLDEQTVDQKNGILFSSFQSQLEKHWFDRELITSMMRVRGIECASKTKYAEAFYSRKICI